MKFVRQLVLTGLLALSAIHPSLAQNITVVTEEYPPYNFLDNDKKISGISTEVVEEVLKRAKLDYQLGLYPWARSYKMAQESPNVLIYSMGRTQKREPMFKWVGLIASADIYLWRLKSRPEIKVATLDDIKNFKIGAIREDIKAHYLTELGVKLDLTSSNISNSRKLAIGRIDMFPMDDMTLKAFYKSESLDPNSVAKVFRLGHLSSGLYMAFSHETSDDIVHKCKVALAEIKKDGTFERIRLKYLK